jgi:hypothetical protein
LAESPRRGRPKTDPAFFADEYALRKSEVVVSFVCKPNEAPRAGKADGEERMRSRRGQRNALKRLISDKGIQGNSGAFLGRIWSGLGQTWLDFEKFGSGLEGQMLIHCRSDN